MADELYAPDIAISAPPEWDAALKSKLDMYFNGLIRFDHLKFELHRELPDDLRGQFVSRETFLRESLSARHRIALTSAVKGCLDHFRPKPVADDDVKVVAYVHVLKDRPPWAVRRACWMIVSGEVAKASREWAPTAARLNELATGLTLPFHGEHAKLVKVLRALPFVKADPETAARMRGLITGWLTRQDPRAASLHAVAMEPVFPKKSTRQIVPPGEFEEF